MNTLGYVGLALIIVSVVGLLIVGASGLFERYVWQALLLFGLSVFGVILLWLDFRYTSEPQQRGM